MKASREMTRFVAIAVVAIIITATFVAIPFVMPVDPNVTDLSHAYRAPGQDGFLLGTDAVGRDVFLRVLFGGSESVLFAFAIVGISLIIGTVIGLAAGLAGGVVDEVLDKVITVFQAFPSFVLAIAIAAILGQGAVNMIIAVTVSKWTEFARLARSLALSLKSLDCVKAARVCGASLGVTARKYLLPNMVSPLVVMAMLSIGDVVITMAGLSFLGLGPGRPTNEWGAMMSEARSGFQFAPWCILAPGAALFITVTVFNLLGDALRDLLDARSHANGRKSVASGSKQGPKGTGPERSREMRKSSKRRWAAPAMLACAVAAVLAIAGCGSGGSAGPAASSQDVGSASAAVEPAAAPAAAPEPVQLDGKVLRAASTGYFYVESMDPANSWDGWLMQYQGITENLLRLTDDFDVEPWLAESVENVDDRTWVFTLRDDVMFSNGEKMTGDAVKACLERTYETNPRAAETLAIESIEADGQTVTIKTVDALPAFKNIICDPLFSIYYVGDDVDYANATPCTGPYKPVEFVFEDHTTLVPNEYYWGGTPKLDGIVCYVYFDDDSQIMAMQNNELDILAMPGAEAYTTLVDNGEFVKLANATTRADILEFNMEHPAVADLAVRTAISYCIDREGYADVINLGNEVPSYGVYSSQLFYGGTEGLNVTVDKMDLEAAAKVLDEAGIVDNDGDGIRELADGTPLKLKAAVFTSYERFAKLADDLQSKLSQVGIEMEIMPTDYLLEDAESFAKADADFTFQSMAMAPTGDPAYFASMCFKTDGSANFGKYSNPEVDALIDELVATFDEDARTDIVKQYSQMILDEVPYIFFANSETSFIARPEVTGVAVAPSEYYFITVDTDLA